MRSRPRLPHRRVLTLLTIAGLGAAVALPVVLLSVGGGVYDHERAALTSAGYQIAVSSGGTHGIDGAHSFSADIDALPGVAAASPVLSVALEAFLPNSTVPVLTEGVLPAAFLATQEPEEADLFPHPLPLGDPTDSAHWDNGTYAGPSAGRVLLSTPFASAERIGLGATLRLGSGTDRNDSTPFEVTGLFGVVGPSIGPTAVFGAILPLSDLQVLSGLARTASGVELDAADSVEVSLQPADQSPTDLDRVAGEIAHLAPFYTVSVLDSEAGQLAQAEGILDGFYVGLSAVGLVIGLAFLALVLLREVESERRSIGIRRAIGVPSYQVAIGLLGRGAALAAAGAVVGILGGVAIVGALADRAGGEVGAVAALAVFDPATLLLLALSVVGLSLVAGSLAVRAALRRALPESLR